MTDFSSFKPFRQSIFHQAQSKLMKLFVKWDNLSNPFVSLISYIFVFVGFILRTLKQTLIIFTSHNLISIKLCSNSSSSKPEGTISLMLLMSPLSHHHSRLLFLLKFQTINDFLLSRATYLPSSSEQTHEAQCLTGSSPLSS